MSPVTPQATIRIDKERLTRWQNACAAAGTNVSEQLRVLMDKWVNENYKEQPDATLGF